MLHGSLWTVHRTKFISSNARNPPEPASVASASNDSSAVIRIDCFASGEKEIKSTRNSMGFFYGFSFDSHQIQGL